MKNQFFYIRKEPLPVEEGKDPEFKEYTDSFNINKVIRTVLMEDDRLLILLDDFHERMQDVPIRSNKGTLMNIKRERTAFQSEIFLEGDDVDRFYKLTNLEV